MKRRAFLEAGSAAALGLALDACSSRGSSRLVLAPGPQRRAAALIPIEAAWDRVIRTTVGLRPHRDSGFVVRADKLDAKTLIHNYGHGGAGMSLSWGTGLLAAELALAQPERRAAVIGCGIVGLTAARQLQRRGFSVTIYAAALPPDTTSNMSWAAFTPLSGLITPSKRTAEWDAQFTRAVNAAYLEHQRLAGREYGVSWIEEYAPTQSPAERAAAQGGGRGGAGSVSAGDTSPQPLLPDALRLGASALGPTEHPFPYPWVAQRPALRFEPAVYLDAIMRDVVTFGGKIVVRKFDTLRDLAALDESLIVNCTGLGAKALFGDEELIPEKGQLVVLAPQGDVNYTVGGAMPRRDGITLGHVTIRGDWSLDVNEDRRRQVVEAAITLFSRMRQPSLLARVAAPPVPRADFSPPPVEAFFDRAS